MTKTLFKITFDRPRRISGDKVIVPTTTLWVQEKSQAQDLMIRLMNKQAETFDAVQRVRMRTFMQVRVTDDNEIKPDTFIKENHMSEEDIKSFDSFRRKHWTKLKLSRGEWFICKSKAFAKIVFDNGLHNWHNTPNMIDHVIDKFTKEVKAMVHKKGTLKRIWFTDFLDGNRKKLPISVWKFNSLKPLIEWAKELEESA